MPPEYAILVATEGKGLLPWAWAVERLREAHGYWLATTRPDGRPHMAVVWGVWLHDRFSFATSADSRKGRNLAVNPHCIVCPEQTTEAVILEGVATPVTDVAAIRQFAEAYAAKYGEEIDTGLFRVYSVRPVVAFATLSDAEEFPATATRWRFTDPSSSGPDEKAQPL
jgi:hypothetical protein